MKKFLFFIILFFIYFQSNGQILISLLLGDKLNSDKLEFGMQGGYTYSNLSNTNGKGLGTFNLGFYFDFKLKNPQWVINTGVQVKSNLGSTQLPVYLLNDPVLDSLFADGFVTRKVGYFNIPALLKYEFKNNFYAELGGQIGIRNSSYDEFYSSVNEKNDSRHLHKINSELKRIDFGVSAGVGYKIMSKNGMNISVRYYYGLANTIKNTTLQSQNNNAYYINLGVPIGKNPKK